MAGHHRAPQGSSGIIVGVAAMAQVFGRSQRTLWRWIRHHNFPAATLPSGHMCTSVSLIDAWLMGRLQGNRPNRPGTFEAGPGEVGGDVPGSDRLIGRQS